MVVRARKNAQQPKPKSTCDDLCTAAGDPGGHGVCVTACNVAGGILDQIPNPFHNSVDDWNNAAHSRDENNKHLNGAVDLPLPLVSIPGSLSGVEGTVARFKSGCVPFKGAPGFSQCKPGTLSMWTEDIAVASGDYDSDGTLDYEHIAAHGYSEELGVDTAPVNVAASETFRGTQGDRFTGGPVSWNSPEVYDAASKWVQKGLAYPDVANVDRLHAWLDRGKILRCPPGQAPSDIVNGLHGQLGTPGVCVSTAGGGQVGTWITGDCQQHIDAGFTWVGPAPGPGSTGHWERLRVGQTKADAKCPPDAGSGSGSVKPAIGFEPVRSLIT